ncbi:MAG: hypothetical protein RI973_495 [Bacteroidota bacterium]|jgi:hypothetical protein
MTTFDKIIETISTAGEALKGQASQLGDVAREKGFQIIEGWVLALPKMEAYGFKTTYFSANLSSNPTLELELRASSDTFPLGRLDAILDENRERTPVNLVFTAVKTTLLLQQKARIGKLDPLVVKIRIKLAPEIKVSFGTPSVEG